MRDWSCTVEVVTPLFLAGADQSKAELRPSSIRGALRFWFRALVGGVIGDSNLAKLQEEEAKLFGDTDRASAVMIRLTGALQAQSFQTSAPGVRYLLWSMLRTQRSYLPDGRSFILTLQTRPGLVSDESLKGIVASLWLLTHLGGLGSRARRGGGGIQVQRVDSPLTAFCQRFNLPELQLKVTSPKALKVHLEQGLKTLRSLFGISPVSSLPTPCFDVLHQDCCRIVVLDKIWTSDARQKGWEKALDEVGQRLGNFRYERGPEHPVIEQIVSSTAGLSSSAPSLTAVGRAAFGLPLPFYFRSVQQDLERGRKKEEARRKAGAVVQPDHKDLDRRASPLFIRVVKLGKGEFTVVMTFFNAGFLPSERGRPIGLALKQGRRTLTTCNSPSTLSLIDQFISELTTPTPGNKCFLAKDLSVDLRP